MPSRCKLRALLFAALSIGVLLAVVKGRPPMRVQDLPPFQSETKPWISSGSPIDFNGFVDVEGPNGGRVVIDGFWLHAVFNDINMATAGLEGEDLTGRAFKRIRVEQEGGLVRWDLAGDESRLACYHLDGAERVREHADLTVADDQAVTVSLYVPMRKRFAEEGKDFSLPADLFRNLKIEGADLTELGVGGGTPTIDDLQYYVDVESHEEFEIQLKAEDEVKATPFTNTSGATLKVAGRCQDLGIFARGATGGASMANFTSIRIPTKNILPVRMARDADLVRPYLRDRYSVPNLQATDGAAVRNDPAQAGSYVPVLWTDEQTSPFDGALCDDIVLSTENTVASCIAIHRQTKPRSDEVAKMVMKRWGVAPGEFKVKTSRKNKRRFQQWAGRGNDLAFLPLVAPLVKRDRRG